LERRGTEEEGQFADEIFLAARPVTLVPSCLLTHKFESKVVTHRVPLTFLAGSELAWSAAMAVSTVG
jgi:hypothetical protein